ncbi:hypothetical protein [Hyalangium gracile]|uniref:hypothetical protein n=1 Tax=Hyalangium gracile TaxID=394092 RepID=UPI001CCC6863|nr:hypothetical protein [Hyalangium gracile]
MSQLSGCPSCQGFNPPSATACLHCGQALESRPGPAPRWTVGWWALASAGVAALTLMACYGAPPCEDGSFDCYEPETPDAGPSDGGADGGP